jgi:hypothetical protein
VVAPLIDPLGAGIHTIPVTEFHSTQVDGTALYVVFDDPATFTTRTAVIAFGAQATGGDSFSIGFGQPVFPDANTVVEFGLAISYGYARGTCQTSYIDVNGLRLTSSAGGDDEGVDQNGALITVGGVGDSRSNPVNPMFNDPCSWTDFTDYDDELYNIAGYIAPGSTSMTVNTFNPSADDNIFVAHLMLDYAAVVGEGGVLTPAQTAVCVGDPVTLTLSLQDGLGNPLAGHPATVSITAGPDAGQVFNGTTDALGRLETSWTGLAVGVDHIVGSFTDSNGVPRQTNESTVSWQLCQAEESGTLSPPTGTHCTSEPHTVTLALVDGSGNPLVNYPASILVMAGPHAGHTASGLSNPRRPVHHDLDRHFPRHGCDPRLLPQQQRHPGVYRHGGDDLAGLRPAGDRCAFTRERNGLPGHGPCGDPAAGGSGRGPGREPRGEHRHPRRAPRGPVRHGPDRCQRGVPVQLHRRRDRHGHDRGVLGRLGWHPRVLQHGRVHLGGLQLGRLGAR